MLRFCLLSSYSWLIVFILFSSITIASQPNWFGWAARKTLGVSSHQRKSFWAACGNCIQ